jgi:hypothetical protein
MDAQSERALDEIADSLQQRAVDVATIIEEGSGHVGPNCELDRERQRAVREYLQKRGVTEQVVRVLARAPNGG